MTFKLSVLDQSFTRSVDSAPEALQETISMAQFSENLGYERFWVSEHHGFSALAGSAPEILIAALGAATQRIRLGSGGIMLPHYSSYKIAEVFSLLSNLYDERIDLGIGRAPGAEMSTAKALANDGRPDFHKFPRQVEELWHYLKSDNTEPTVSPKPPKSLPLWMLGSSPDSAKLAAIHGLPYNLALFINPAAAPAITEYYQHNFQPSSQLDKPYTAVTISTFCAKDDDYAQLLARSYDVNFFRYITGQARNNYLSPSDVERYPSNPALDAFIASRQPLRAVGRPKAVKEKIETIQSDFNADEVMLVSNIFHFEERKRSFELVMNEFNE